MPAHFLSSVDGEGGAPVVAVPFHLLSWWGGIQGFRDPACLGVEVESGEGLGASLLGPEAAGQCFHRVTWGLILNLSEAQAGLPSNGDDNNQLDVRITGGDGQGFCSVPAGSSQMLRKMCVCQWESRCPSRCHAWT